jgi:hypothetical protein
MRITYYSAMFVQHCMRYKACLLSLCASSEKTIVRQAEVQKTSFCNCHSLTVRDAAQIR